MASKTPFKELKIWQKSMELVDAVYSVTTPFPREEIYGLMSQARRSAVSVPSNIAEGSQRTSDKEFANFILIAKGSLAELETQMLIANRQGYLQKEQLQNVLARINELERMLYSFHGKLTA